MLQNCAKQTNSAYVAAQQLHLLRVEMQQRPLLVVQVALRCLLPQLSVGKPHQPVLSVAQAVRVEQALQVALLAVA